MDIRRTLGIVAVALGALGILGFSWVWFAPCALGGCVPIEDLAAYQAEGSELLDMNGEPFARLATVNRRIVSLDSLPEDLPHAIIAIEDQRFYDHSGIDFRRTVGALLANLRLRRVAEGGSTISQQLARNLFPDWLPYQDRNMRRKILEARVARQLERSLSKDKILELYLNHIYLGSGAYGVEAAAATYFGKPASEVTLAEAATLAGIPQAPSRINPRADIESATSRRNLVLDEMVDTGYLTTAQAEEAKKEPIEVVDAEPGHDGPESSYFVERVRRELEETVGSRFYTAGLKVHTTLDPVAQGAAEEELERQLRAIESGGFGTFRHPTFAAAIEAGRTDYLQGALVMLDARSGEVRALVGGRDFERSSFDRATQALRQPGSAFKPFVYVAALERYGTPTHIVEDSPLRITLASGQVWEPRNYADSYSGPITIREALMRSRNTATVRLAQEVGIGSTVRVARATGIRSDIPELPATALGAAEVRPIELVGAYAAFANGGDRVEPHLIRRVTDRSGRTLWEARPQRERAIDPAVAFVLTTMLQDVVDQGTGRAVRSVGFNSPAAGKTGTTNDGSDVWFVGYTPDLVAGVWIGLDDPTTIVSGASGGTLAAPVWGRTMQKVYATREAPAGWSQPGGVVTAEVDRSTGSPVSEFCPAQGPTYTEYFIRSVPTNYDCMERYDRSLYVLDDSLWIDEEWDIYTDFDYDEYDPYDPDRPVDLRSGEIDWPELDALRRRIEQERRDRELRSEPLPGDSLGIPALPREPGDPADPDPDPATPPTTGEPPAEEPGERPPPRLLGEPARPPGGV